MKMQFLISALLLLSLNNGFSQDKILLEDVASYAGTEKTIVVCGKIFGGRFIQNVKRSPTVLNMGGPYPDQLLTLLIWEEDLEKFPRKPELFFANKEVCITGQVIEYNRKPEIVLHSPDQIQVLDSDFVNKDTAITDTTSLASVLTTQDDKKLGEAPLNKDISVKHDSSEIKEKDRDISLTGSVTIRSGPSLDFPVVLKVKAGSMITVLASNNGWSKIRLKKNGDTLIGYIESALIK